MSSEEDSILNKEWGNIDEVVNEPPIDVQGDETWCSCIGCCLTCPICCPLGTLGCCGCCYVKYGIGSCSDCSTDCCSVEGSVRHNRPCWMSWVWWRYIFAGVFAFVRNKASRLGLFLWELAAYGGQEYWFHGLGIWNHTYEDVGRILRSNQVRTSGFACMNAPIPDLFASNILIFLSNDGDSESQWATLRTALHNFFLSGVNYDQRISELPARVAEDWPDPEVSQLSDLKLLQKLVAKSIFYIMFGTWVDDEQAEVLIGWRTAAGIFIFPRLVQRFICNFGINKVKKLRENTVDIVQDLGQEELFIRMNDSLGKWKRDSAVKLCDEMMFVIGFAGIGGTCACVESCGAFLQTKIPSEAPGDKIDFNVYDSQEKMVAAYRQNPVSYIKEVCRQDPPVTSACYLLKEEVTTNLAGRDMTFPSGTYAQYALSVANRDEAYFPDPNLFDPTRTNLNDTFTWNGAFGNPGQDEMYPRICPGRYLALDIAQVILDHATSAASAEA